MQSLSDATFICKECGRINDFYELICESCFAKHGYDDRGIEVEPEDELRAN